MSQEIRFENIDNCPICGVSKRIQWSSSKDSPLAVQCEFCSLIYMDRRLAEDEVEVFYNQYNEKRNIANIDLLKKRQKMYEQDRRFVELFIRTGSFLDIGCGSGDFISSFSMSVNKSGFDIDKEALRSGIANHSEITFYQSLIEIPSNTLFDCIIFRGTLQYQRNLRETVQFCYDHLNNGSYLILLATPNGDSPVARLQRESWVLFNPFEHLYYFTMDTISLLFSKLERVYFDYPYIGTPYEDQRKDLELFISLCRGDDHESHFPFWGSMMNVVFRKVK